MRVAVIGAGPSGLVTLKYLLTAHRFFRIDPIEAVLFESEDAIGGTFKHRSYEDGELVSSKYLTTYSDFRYKESDPSKDPDYMSIEDYISYLERYCTQFKLWPYIRLSTPVRHVRQLNDKHIITASSAAGFGAQEELEFDAVAVCSGLHVIPNIPIIDGIENVPHAFHSSAFKSRVDFGHDKNVMILGSGETAMDVVHLAITSSTKSVTMCHRNGFLATPKRVPRPVVLGLNPPSVYEEPSIPIDVTSASLLDTAFVHPKLEESNWLWNFYDGFTKTTLFLNFSSKYGYDQFVGEIKDYHSSSIFFNKSPKAMAYISAPYRPTNFLARLKRRIINVPIPDTQGRHIELAPWPDYIDSTGTVHFRDTGRPESERIKKLRIQPDIVVYCTGYTQQFHFLDSNYPTPDTASIRRIWRPDMPSVGFIGFVRPGFGAIPPLSEFQAQLWILNLLQNNLGVRLKQPIEPQSLGPHPYYNLRVNNVPLGSDNSGTVGVGARKITYGVDHETYAYQLALDMGSTPPFLSILRRGPKMLICWALAANFNTKFRLEGPWKWSEGDGSGKAGEGRGAEDIMENELWETVTRRGLFSNLMLGGLPILFFGWISFVLWIYWGIRERLEKARAVARAIVKEVRGGRYERVPETLSKGLGRDGG